MGLVQFFARPCTCGVPLGSCCLGCSPRTGVFLDSTFFLAGAAVATWAARRTATNLSVRNLREVMMGSGRVIGRGEMWRNGNALERRFFLKHVRDRVFIPWPSDRSILRGIESTIPDHVFSFRNYCMP